MQDLLRIPELGPLEFVTYGVEKTPDGRIGITANIRRWVADRRIGSVPVTRCWTGETFSPASRSAADSQCARRNKEIRRPAMVADVVDEAVDLTPGPSPSVPDREGDSVGLTERGTLEGGDSVGQGGDVCRAETDGPSGEVGRTASVPLKERASGTSRGGGGGGSSRRRTGGSGAASPLSPLHPDGTERGTLAAGAVGGEGS